MKMPIKIRRSYTTNRDISKRPKKRGFFCDYCDRAWVTDSRKCPVCRQRAGDRKRRLKKDC